MRVIRNMLFFAVAALSAASASADIEWLATDYDFGIMREAAGPRTGSVKGVNRGGEATVITRVRPSCGCTGASFTEEPVEPGDTAEVTFTYNPVGRPGRFDKTVKIYEGEKPDPVVIHIRGTVIGTPSTLSRDYPVEIGPLRLASRSVDLGRVKQGAARHVFLKAYNQSAEPIAPRWVNANPALDMASAEPLIEAGDVGTFSFYFNSRDEERMGPVSYDIVISAGDAPDAPSDTITVTGEIIPDSSALSPEEVDRGPRAYVDPELVDLGAITDRKPKKISFDIRNDGKRDLNIGRIYSFSDQLKIKRYPTSLRSGKKAKAEALLLTSEMAPGPFRLKIEVVSDDPIHPFRTVSVVGELK